MWSIYLLWNDSTAMLKECNICTLILPDYLLWYSQHIGQNSQEKLQIFNEISHHGKFFFPKIKSEAATKTSFQVVHLLAKQGFLMMN